MVVVLCDSFEEAQEYFKTFLYFLETYEPYTISKLYESSYCIETDDDIRYIFVDYRFKRLFQRMDRMNDFIESYEFFNGIDDYYEMEDYLING